MIRITSYDSYIFQKEEETNEAAKYERDRKKYMYENTYYMI